MMRRSALPFAETFIRVAAYARVCWLFSCLLLLPMAQGMAQTDQGAQRAIRLTEVRVSAPGDRENRAYFNSINDLNAGKGLKADRVQQRWMEDAFALRELNDTLVVRKLNEALAAEGLRIGDLDKAEALDVARLRADIQAWRYELLKDDSYRFSCTTKWELYDAVDGAVLWDTLTTCVTDFAKHREYAFGTTLVNGMWGTFRPVVSMDVFRKWLRDDGTIFSPAYTAWPTLNMPGTATEPRKVRDVLPGVVTLVRGKEHCSGVVVSSEGHVVTLDLVADADTGAIQVLRGDGTKEEAHLLRRNPTAGIALFRIGSGGSFPLRAVQSTLLDLGEEVYAVGTPMDVSLGQSVSTGVLSSRRPWKGRTYLQTDVRVSPGSGGGALTDGSGNLIGILFSKWWTGEAQGIAFAIPIEDVEHHLKLVLLR